MAAARKVSAAASTTRRPRSVSLLASFAMVVVLPTPFTPTTSQMAGEPSVLRDVLAAKLFTSTWRRSSKACADEVASAFTNSSSLRVVGTPTSADRRCRSISNQTLSPSSASLMATNASAKRGCAESAANSRSATSVESDVLAENAASCFRRRKSGIG